MQIKYFFLLSQTHLLPDLANLGEKEKTAILLALPQFEVYGD